LALSGTLESYAGRWFVLKIGGELVSDKPALAGSVGQAIKRFLAAGIRVCVVHGGGPQATALSKRLRIEPNLVGGRRVTDEATLEVMKMTLAGQVSVEIASAFKLAGVPALCTTGVSAGLVEATRRPPTVVTGGGPDPVDFGLVGDVKQVDTVALTRLADAGFVPVMGSLCADAQGAVLNVNADTVATRVAAALKASKLFLISNVPGVLANKDDPSTRIHTLTPAQARAQIAAGVIQGGMVIKVEESLAMLQQGIDAIHIVGLTPPSSLLEEVLDAGSRGTAFRLEGS
jgi:acetylglutamate kinase